jgi:hypothetical protein
VSALSWNVDQQAMVRGGTHTMVLATAALAGLVLVVYMRRRKRPTASLPGPGMKPTASGQSVAERAAPEGEYKTGDPVRLTGLVNKTSLNNKCGRILGFDAANERYKVQLEDGKSLKVKVENLMADPDGADAAAKFMSPGELLALTMADHGALTSAHAARVVALLRTAMTPADAGSLLRCCCCFDSWHQPRTKNITSGEESISAFPSDKGPGLVLCSDAARVARLQLLNKPPSGHKSVVGTIAGRDVFSPEGTSTWQFISFNPQESEVDSAGEGVFTCLTTTHYPALNHMSAALRVESSLASLVELATTKPATAAQLQSLAVPMRQFATHTFFCFNAADQSKAPGSILPMVSYLPDGTSFMMLYTCEMLLEGARPVLAELGAFQGHSAVPAGAVTADDVLHALTQPGAGSAGVHLNEFVPNLSRAYTAAAFQTDALKRLIVAARATTPTAAQASASLARAASNGSREGGVEV